MDSSPAFTCCTAWLPVIAPSEATYSLVRINSQSLSAPIRASVCSILTVPLSRTTSSAVYGRRIPAQRPSSHPRSISAARLPLNIPTSFPCSPLPFLHIYWLVIYVQSVHYHCVFF